MSFPAWPEKDPDALLDYVIDWSAWLAEVSDTIVASTWTVDVGITKDSDAIIAAATKTQIWLRGGTVGQKYTLVNHITTAGSRQDDRTVTIKVKQR